MPACALFFSRRHRTLTSSCCMVGTTYIEVLFIFYFTFQKMAVSHGTRLNKLNSRPIFQKARTETCKLSYPPPHQPRNNPMKRAAFLLMTQAANQQAETETHRTQHKIENKAHKPSTDPRRHRRRAPGHHHRAPRHPHRGRGAPCGCRCHPPHHCSRRSCRWRAPPHRRRRCRAAGSPAGTGTSRGGGRGSASNRPCSCLLPRGGCRCGTGSARGCDGARAPWSSSAPACGAETCVARTRERGVGGGKAF